MGYYLTLRAISTPILFFVLREALLTEDHVLSTTLHKVYYFGFFATYLATAVLLFFICIEVFRSALAAFPGITKLAIVIFRWAAVVSVIVSLSSISYTHRGLRIIPDISYGLMHSVSVLELCLLAFLCLSMNALRLTVRDLSFGIALGFGVMSSGDFIVASWISRVASYNDPVQFVYEALILATLAIWMALLRSAGARAQAGPDAGELDDLSLERNRLRTGPHGNQGRRAAACQQLLPFRCGARGGEGAGAEHEGPRVRDVRTGNREQGVGNRKTKGLGDCRGLLILERKFSLVSDWRLVTPSPARSRRSVRGGRGQ